MATIQLRDIELHTLDRGKGTPIVLVHGFPLNHTMWRMQIDAFAGQFRLIAPDLRGFGQSSVTAGTATMEQMADDLAGMLDAMSIRQPVVFCGLSMGGYVAWQFALRHRQRLAKLVLCDTRAVADSAEAAAGRRKSAERALAEGSVSFIAESMLGKLFAPATASKQPALIEETRQVILGTSPVGVAAALLGMALRPDVTSRLPEIDVPALVVCGQYDAISPPEEMRGIAERLPQARFVEIKEAGHMAPLEQPAAVNGALARFLTD